MTVASIRRCFGPNGLDCSGISKNLKPDGSVLSKSSERSGAAPCVGTGLGT
jgi:hypothetical protein